MSSTPDIADPPPRLDDGPPLRVAVVGPGGWGRQHTRVYRERADTELVAVVGRNEGRVRVEADRVGAHGYTDIDEMLGRERPDLVSVCLPNEEHFGPTMQLLESGLPLLVEKPLVFDLDEADRLLEKAAERKVFFAINFNHRYAEPMLRLRHALERGELGDPMFAIWRFGGEANRGESPHKNIIETQCHGFDLLEHLVGPIVSVAAQMTDKSYGAWSTVALALEFANGAVGTMLGSYDSSYAYPVTQLLEINGTAGRGVVLDTVGELWLSKAGNEETTVWRSGYFNDEARSFHQTFDRHVAAVVEALRAGGSPPVPAERGRRALLVATRAIESHTTGRRITVET